MKIKKINFINNLLIKKLNLKIYKSILKIFPNIKLRSKGFSTVIELKKKYSILYLKIFKHTSSFLFNNLVDIIVLDYPWKKSRFFINYIFRSSVFNKTISVYVKTSLNNYVYSISNLFNSSSWIERECWDFFGIFFTYHKNLKRILTDYGFKGFPLKKYFPLIGYKKLFFSIFSKMLKNSLIKKSISK